MRIRDINSTSKELLATSVVTLFGSRYLVMQGKKLLRKSTASYSREASVFYWLNLLARGEMYGYEILQSASVRSAKAFEFKEGTLYPALHLLEKKGLVRSKWRTGNNGRERKYYSLTTKG